MSARKPAPGRLQRVADFVNTLDREPGSDVLDSPERMRAWLCEQGLLEAGVAVSRAERRRAIELREAIRAILRSHTDRREPPPAALAMLDAIAVRARVGLRFSAVGGSRLEPGVPGVEGALGRIVAIVHEAIADGSWQRLKACHDHGCEWAFYDHTKNRSGTWCNMAVCGNRAKARAYRQRRGAAVSQHLPRAVPAD